MALALPIYLDNHATTRVDPRVLEAMLPWFSQEYGNAASRQHEFGWRAEAAVQQARTRVAGIIGASPEEIVFTSGATESINLALKGAAESFAARGNHLITAATEHAAVLDTFKRLSDLGFETTVLPVDHDGLVRPEQVAAAIRKDTILVSVMTANNEIGTIAPIREIARICRSRGVLFHTDATQAIGKISFDVRQEEADLVSFSAHKMYGPKGIGALYLRSARPALRLVPQMDGGGHERGLRSGTLNVPAIVGFGMACEIAAQELEEDALRVGRLRDALVERMQAGIEGVRLHGHPALRLPNNANLAFPGVRADALMMQMKEIAVSTGSACSTATPRPSHVLRALGLSDEEVLSSVRFGLGRFTTGEEVEYAAARVVQAAKTLRERSQRLVGAI